MREAVHRRCSRTRRIHISICLLAQAGGSDSHIPVASGVVWMPEQVRRPYVFVAACPVLGSDLRVPVLEVAYADWFGRPCSDSSACREW